VEDRTSGPTVPFATIPFVAAEGTAAPLSPFVGVAADDSAEPKVNPPLVDPGCAVGTPNHVDDAVDAGFAAGARSVEDNGTATRTSAVLDVRDPVAVSDFTVSSRQEAGVVAPMHFSAVVALSADQTEGGGGECGVGAELGFAGGTGSCCAGIRKGEDVGAAPV
jgi:hypothetical protein